MLEQLREAAVIPVITLDHAEDALPLAGVLRDAGMKLVEIALRSDAALEAIATITAAGLGLAVAAGTIRAPADMHAARAAGATLLISPGSTPALIDAARTMPVPWLPGASTPSEVMVLHDAGYPVQKLFPAQPHGLAQLATLEGPFPAVSFVPTGGIHADDLGAYLNRANVVAVAGSWIASRDLIMARRWNEIGERASAAMTLATRIRQLGMLDASSR